jgi:tetratricopeptide (TPR) repeat protein
LEAEIPNTRKQSEKALLYFSAATQYYHGGIYGRAEEVSRRVQAKLLPPHTRKVLEDFRRDLKDRAAPEYRLRQQTLIQEAWSGKQYAKMLEIFKNHPYVLPPWDMAFYRGKCCEQLKNYRAAALFFKDAIQFKPDDLNLVLAAPTYTLSLIAEGKLSEAWEYVQHQLALIPSPVPNINASLIRHDQALKATTGEEMSELSKEQLRYCAKALELFDELPAQEKDRQELRNFMAHCLELAASSRVRLGDKAGAILAATKAVEFSPSFGPIYVMRGLLTFPSEEAMQDFRKAIQLGEQYHVPYAYLARWHFMRNEFPVAAEWCEQALIHNPSPRIRAQLLEMLAISRSQLGFDSTVIESLFAQAQELDPDNSRINKNWTVFQETVAVTSPTQAISKWDRSGIENGDEITHELLEQERRQSSKRPANSIQRELMHTVS